MRVRLVTTRVLVVLLVSIVAFGCTGWTSNRAMPGWSLDIYEDGSAVLYDGDQERWTWQDQMFPWDCGVRGNRYCGEGVQPSKRPDLVCKTRIVKPYRTAKAVQPYRIKVVGCADGSYRITRLGH